MKTSKYLAVLSVLAILALLGAAIDFGIRTRVADANTLARATEEKATPIVNVVHPRRGAPTSEIVLPGGAQAFVDAPIYARTNGYLKRWYFDIGSPVKQGQLLAEIETPEVDQQLLQAFRPVAVGIGSKQSVQPPFDLMGEEHVPRHRVTTSNASLAYAKL